MGWDVLKATTKDQRRTRRAPVYVIVICEAQRVDVGKEVSGRGGEREVVHVKNESPFEHAN